MEILLTGGAGYIGSHTCVELLHAGYQVIVVDNLSNSSFASLERVKKITAKNIFFYQTDIRDKNALVKIFTKHEIKAVIHFAGLKSVADSTRIPLDYFNNNVLGAICLCEVMMQFHCKNILFSSSATVYGANKNNPLTEKTSLAAINPYGKSKWMVEEILQDLYQSDKNWHISILRYFNPVGAHKSGLIGEMPKGTPNNLMPYMTQVALGKRKCLYIFGDDYDTKDGTGVRDYIHVVDLAKGHVKTLELSMQKAQILILNLGTGRGYSVFEMLQTFEKVSKKNIRYQVVARRPGDVASHFADVGLASKILNWQAQRSLSDMCLDSWRWQVQNPNGYADE